MKKIILLFLISFSCIFGYSQTTKRNIIKVFPTSPFFGKTTLGYERVINDKGSFTFNLGLPTGVDLMKYMDSDDIEDFDLNDAALDGLLIMPGYRFNISRRAAPVGFYLETYMKFEQFNLEMDGYFIDAELDRFMGNIDGDYSGFGVGFQMGFQYLIGDVVSFELTLVGLEAKLINAELLYKDLDGGVDLNDVYIDVQDAVDDIPIIGNSIEVEQGHDYVKAKAHDMFFPGFRMAFSLGIAF